MQSLVQVTESVAVSEGRPDHFQRTYSGLLHGVRVEEAGGLVSGDGAGRVEAGGGGGGGGRVF